MSYASATDEKFQSTLKNWLQSQREILVLIRFSRAAGSQSFELFSSAEILIARLHNLASDTCVTAFKQPQIPIRGVVNDEFIGTCLGIIPDGVAFLIKETTLRTAGCASWYFHTSGASHSELLEELEDMRGHDVAAGLYPPWPVDNEDVISAIVPDQHGVVTTGMY